MKILVLGAGGIGGYFGGRLVEAGADVTFLVRARRRQQLADDGLRLESVHGNVVLRVQAVERADAAPEPDIILLTCKAYDLPTAIDAIRPAVGPQTAVLPLLNGIHHLDVLNDAFGPARVLGGTAKIGVTLTADGIVKHLNDWRTLTFGEQDGTMSARVLDLAAAFGGTPVEARAVSNILLEMWEKFVHLSTVAGMTCLMRANLGEIARTPDGSALMIQFFETAAEVARRHGHSPGEAFLEGFRQMFRRTDLAYTASMLRDLEKGGPIEADHIVGAMLHAARAVGVDDTLLRVAHTHLKAYEERRAAGRL